MRVRLRLGTSDTVVRAAVHVAVELSDLSEDLLGECADHIGSCEGMLLMGEVSQAWRRSTLASLTRKSDVEEMPEFNYEESLDKFHQSIFKQITLGTFGGTLSEYNTKVIQYGYIAMFACTFPLGIVASAGSNYVEIKLDARKLMFNTRRPRYAGAEDIGTWQSVMSSLSWLAIVVNVAIICFTSYDLRNYVVIPEIVDGTTPLAPRVWCPTRHAP